MAHTQSVPAAAQAALAQPAALPNIYAKTVAISVDRSKFGNRRKVSLANVNVELDVPSAAERVDNERADKSMLALSKKLLQSPELKAITTLDNEVQAFMDNRSVPAFFKPGIYLVPLKAVEEVEAGLVAFRDKRIVLRDAFLAVYPATVEAMKDVLGELYNPVDYPSVEDMRSMFGFSWRYLNLGAPGQLQSINAKLYAEQRQKIEASVQDAAQEIRAMLRATMQQLVAHMIDRLTPGPDGKRKRFHDSLVDNFNAFVDHFDLRNVTDDAALQQLVAQARRIVTVGLDADALRHSDAVRDHVVAGLAEVKATLDTLVIAKGRVIELDDDAPAFGGKSAGQRAWATRKARQAAQVA
jgi:Protein of unknown function (DUF3150)